MLFEMGEQGRVGEMLKTGGIISHAVVESWEVEVHRTVPMGALEGRAVVAEVRRGAIARDSAFVHSGDGRGVVTPIGNGRVAQVVVMGHERSLGQDTGLFQVTVGDDTGRIVEGDEPLLNIRWERETPEEGFPWLS